MTHYIDDIVLRGILDSRGEVTIEAEVRLELGGLGRGAAARAISPGRREKMRLAVPALGATTLADSGLDLDQHLKNIPFSGQQHFDQVLCRLNAENAIGANVTLALSLGFARACAAEREVSLDRYLSHLVQGSPALPRPLINVFSGGIHSHHPCNPFQQIMIVPQEKSSLSACLATCLQVYCAMESRLTASGIAFGYSASSGLLVNGLSHTALLDHLAEELAALGLESKVVLAVDVAAEHLRTESGLYRLGRHDVDGSALLAALSELVSRYNIVLVEDPFDPHDAQLWRSFTTDQGGQIEVIGDDLFATDAARVTRSLATGVVLKMDQIGTLSGALAAAAAARAQGMTLCVSHRSGETEDTAMCDLAVALGAEFIKIGGPRRGDRVAKYNQLLRLAETTAELPCSRAA